MAEETKETKDVKTEEKEEVNEEKAETKEETTTPEEPEEKGISKEKLYGAAMVVGGIVVFAALAMFYPHFWDLFVKGIVFSIALAAIALIILGIVFAIYA